MINHLNATTRALIGAGVALALSLGATVSANAERDALVELGKRIYDDTAGGVGCAYCHGPAGVGGDDAPRIVGATKATIRNSLTGVPLMGFITLSEAELDAVTTYLDYVADPSAYRAAAAEEPATGADDVQPEPAPEVVDDAGAPDTDTLLTVNVSITDAGIEPASVSIPLGQRVQLVVRNRTYAEHHFRVAGLEAADLLWLAREGEERQEGVSDEEHAEHHAQHDAHGDAVATDPEADDHDAHHASIGFVPWRATSPAGVEPTGDEVHAWAYANAPGGGMDVVIFTPTRAGTFVVDCPLHPDMVAEIVVTGTTAGAAAAHAAAVETQDQHAHDQHTHDEHAHDEHAHDEAAVEAEEPRTLPPLGDEADGVAVVTVTASAGGFTPAAVEVVAGEPVVVVFTNTSADEHHFHIMGLEPADLSWFRLSDNALEGFDVDALFAADRAEGHICSSVTGICRLGINVHLHADAGGFDAVMFTPPTRGEFAIECPLHPEMGATFAVR